MRRVVSTYYFVVAALAVLAGAAIVAMFALIVLDVTMRNLGFRPPLFTTPVVEYLLLYITAFMAPWLARQKKHVYVDVIRAHLPDPLPRVVEKFNYGLCIVATATFAVVAGILEIDAIISGRDDIRGIDIPHWIVFAPLAPCFLALAVEFARYLFGSESFYHAPDIDSPDIV